MIDAALLDDVAGKVSAQGPGEEISAYLRSNWPKVHFTYCQDDDITTAQPIREHKTFNLYLVVGGEGCISFTSSEQTATGIVVAEVEEWEE